MICHLCGQKTISQSMSFFNTDMCCSDCLDKEKKHPKYQEARDAEEAAVRRGETNFPGIGKPEDL